MATIVSFHAHPDDESIQTGGTLAKASAAGHRAVLVFATRGEHGEVAPGFLDDGEQLGLRRVKETFASASILGIERVEFLGYIDSGMMGEPTNHDPYSFWSTDIDQAAHRLAGILREEQERGPIVLTIYDDHGGYGHPDHIQVHRVGWRAAEMAGVTAVFEATMNRDHIREMMLAAAAESPDFEMPDRPEQDDFGTPETDITHRIDIKDVIAQKRSSMVAHASQIPPDSFFLKMPEEIFREAFGSEWFIASGRPRPAGTPLGDDLFADLDG